MDHTSNPEKLRILVCGAGIGGLALVVALSKFHGQHVVIDIIERDESSSMRSQGYSLTIQQTGISALKELGVYEEVKNSSLATQSRGHKIYDSQGKVLFSPKEIDKQELNLIIPRSELRRILIHNLPKTTQVHWGVWVHDFHQNKDHTITAHLTNVNLKQTYDIIVSTEGIYSKIRDSLIGDPLIYLGVGMVNGIVKVTQEEGAKLDSHLSVSVESEEGIRIFYKPFQPGYIMWQQSFILDQGKVKELKGSEQEKIISFAVSKVEKWTHPIVQFIKQTEPERVICGCLFTRNQLSEDAIQNNGRFILIGDSCHPMAPFKGQGANQALEDAVYFSQHIKNTKNLEDQLQQIQLQIINRVKDLQAVSADVVQVLHSQNSLQNIINQNQN